MKILVRGGRTSRIEGAGGSAKRPDRTLVAGLRRAHRELANRGIDMTDRKSLITEASGLGDPYLRKLAGLAFLAPDIQRAILEGRQPADLKLADLLAMDLPLCWTKQREMFAM